MVGNEQSNYGGTIRVSKYSKKRYGAAGKENDEEVNERGRQERCDFVYLFIYFLTNYQYTPFRTLSIYLVDDTEVSRTARNVNAIFICPLVLIFDALLTIFLSVILRPLFPKGSPGQDLPRKTRARITSTGGGARITMTRGGGEDSFGSREDIFGGQKR